MIVRPARHTDFFSSGVYLPKTCPVFGTTVVIDGAIATFGAALKGERHYWLHFEIFDDRARVALLLHRIGLAMMHRYDVLGFPAVYSAIDAISEPGAERWHQAMGFTLVPEAEKDDEIRMCESVLNYRVWIRRRRPN